MIFFACGFRYAVSIFTLSGTAASRLCSRAADAEFPVRSLSLRCLTDPFPAKQEGPEPGNVLRIVCPYLPCWLVASQRDKPEGLVGTTLHTKESWYGWEMSDRLLPRPVHTCTRLIHDVQCGLPLVEAHISVSEQPCHTAMV